MAKITFGKPNLDKLTGVPWWIPAAIAAALYVGVQWGLPAAASSPAFKILEGILKPLGLLMIALCGVFAAFLYYKQRIKPVKTVRLLEPHFSTPTPAGSSKKADATGQVSGDSPTGAGPSSPASQTPEWSIELLRRIEAKGFAELIAAYFREESFRTETAPIGADEGSDINLYEKGKREVYAVVQCRPCNQQQVGVRLVRELLGAMTHAKVPRGIFVTTGDYVQAATDFASKHPIVLITGEMLLTDILSCSADAKIRLMNVLTEAGVNVMPVAPEEVSAAINDTVDEASNAFDIPVAESNANLVAADPAAEAMPDAAPASANGATDAESNTLDFPLPEVTRENEPAEKSASPAEPAAPTTLDFPILEFPSSEPKTKTTEFFGVFK